MSKSDRIIEFIKERPLLTVSSIERMALMPATTLDKAMQGNRKIPVKYIEKVEEVLSKYGYEK